MTHDEALRLWAYQWVTRGEIPDLPDYVRLYVVDKRSVNFGSYIRLDKPLGREVIDMHKFVVEDQDAIRTCRAGYGERTKTFVVTPVETHLRYDLATAEPEIAY